LPGGNRDCVPMLKYRSCHPEGAARDLVFSAAHEEEISWLGLGMTDGTHAG
jgi:hypothetical protein